MQYGMWVRPLSGASNCRSRNSGLSKNQQPRMLCKIILLIKIAYLHCVRALVETIYWVMQRFERALRA